MQKYVFHQHSLFILQLFLLKRLLDGQPRSNEVCSMLRWSWHHLKADAWSVAFESWWSEAMSSPGRTFLIMKSFIEMLLCGFPCSLSSEFSLNALCTLSLLLIKLSFLWIWSQSHWNGYQAVTIAKSNSTRQVFNLALLSLQMLCPSFLSVKILVWISSKFNTFVWHSVFGNLDNEFVFFGLTNHHIAIWWIHSLWFMAYGTGKKKKKKSRPLCSFSRH